MWYALAAFFIVGCVREERFIQLAVGYRSNSRGTQKVVNDDGSSVEFGTDTSEIAYGVAKHAQFRAKSEESMRRSIRNGNATVGITEVTHYWPCKNANLFRNGVSQHAATKQLSTPLWEWEVPGHTATLGHIEVTPLIDSNFNVYLGTTRGGIFALRRDGSQLWQHNLPEDKHRIMTGALYRNSLYVPTSGGVALSLDLATGSQNWYKQYAPAAGVDAWSTTAADGLIVVPGVSNHDQGNGNDVIVALNADDGSEKWRYKPDANVYNFMPAVVDGKLLFIDFHGNMYCLLLSDGTLQWKTNDGVPSTFTTAGVAVGPNGLAFTNFNTKGSSEGVLKAYDIQTGKERWTQSFPHESSAAPVVGHLGPNAPVAVVVGLGHNVGGYKPKREDGKGFLRAFDADTGKEIWTFETPSKMLHGSAGDYSTPDEDSIPDTWSNAAISSDGTIYVGWEGGKQFALDGATGRKISEHYTGWGQQGEPAVADGFVVFPSIGKVVAFGSTGFMNKPWLVALVIVIRVMCGQ